MDELNRAVQELRVSTAASDLARRTGATRNRGGPYRGRLRVLKTPWRAETDAREALAGEVKGARSMN